MQILEIHYHSISTQSGKGEIEYSIYDAVSDVGESGVHWRSNFQIGSRVLKIVINLFSCISMAYNVISCIEVAEITQTLKVADFSM